MTIELRDFQFSNFARTTLAANVEADATELSVASAALFPTLDPTYDEIFAIILRDSDTNDIEIMYVTEVNDNTFTVERAKESTTARAWEFGNTVIHSVTLGFLQQLSTPPPSAAVLSVQLAGYIASLSWTAVVSDEGAEVVSYLIYRRVNSGAYALLASVDGSTLEYEDSGLAIATDYDYYVIADMNVGPDSVQSNVASVSTAVPEYFMVSDASFGVYSDDSETWTAGATSGVSKDHPGIAFHPGLSRWLMTGAGGGGDTQYSDDAGLNWTSQTSGIGQNMERCRYAYGYFFMGSNNGSVFRSATGLSGSWTAQATGARSYGLWYSEAEDRLVSCGNQNADTSVPVIYYTDDGGTWSLGSITGLASDGDEPRHTLYAVAYDEVRGLWWTINGLGQIYSTDDLVSGTWTLRYTVDATAVGNCAFAFKPGSTIVVTTGVNGIWTSQDDGDTFTEYLTTTAFRDILWSDYVAKFIAVTQVSIHTSADGESWTTQTEPSNGYGAIGKAEL